MFAAAACALLALLGPQAASVSPPPEHQVADLVHHGGACRWSGAIDSPEGLSGAFDCYDVPMRYAPRVQKWIDYYRGRGRPWMTRYLARSTRFLPEMRRIFAEEGLPSDLVYVAMIESGLSPDARSRAGAVGQWQFLRATARDEGIVVDRWVDPRRDPDRSTRAAARHLKRLHGRFDDWHLAIAAYNAGEGRMKRAIRRSKSRDYWKITQRRWLFRETREYVPKLIAAALIAKHPEAFGFDAVDYQLPVPTTAVRVPPETTLAELARVSRVDTERLRELNPWLRESVTPPDRETDLQVPAVSVAWVERWLSEERAAAMNEGEVR